MGLDIAFLLPYIRSVTLQDVRNKFSECEWKARRNQGPEPKLMHVVFNQDGETVRKAQICSQRERLWAFPSTYNQNLLGPIPGAPWRHFENYHREEDQWKLNPVGQDVLK